MIKFLGAGILALLMSFAVPASAEIVVYPGAAPHVHSLQYHGGTLRVGYTGHASLPPANVIVVNKLATYWITPGHGSARIRITIPVQFYMSSWDVKALERELERLGVKVKPKPVPKPRPTVSG